MNYRRILPLFIIFAAMLMGCGNSTNTTAKLVETTEKSSNQTVKDQGDKVILDFLNSLFTDEGAMLLDNEDWLKQHCSEQCLEQLHQVAVRSQGENAGYWGSHLRGLQDGMGQSLELQQISRVQHDGRDRYFAQVNSRMLTSDETGLYELVFLNEIRNIYYDCTIQDNRVVIENVDLQTNDVQYDTLPDDLDLVGKGCGYHAYIHYLQQGNDGDGENQVELWLTDPDCRVAKKLFTTTTKWQEVDWENAAEYSVNQIMAVDRVSFVQNTEDGLTYMVINGCPDARNVFTYLMPVSLQPDKALFLPAANGFHMFNPEKNELVCSTYAYHPEGGRYDIVKVFDFKGNVVRTFTNE